MPPRARSGKRAAGSELALPAPWDAQAARNRAMPEWRLMYPHEHPDQERWRLRDGDSTHERLRWSARRSFARLSWFLGIGDKGAAERQPSAWVWPGHQDSSALRVVDQGRVPRRR
jgi:hypothetical protein